MTLKKHALVNVYLKSVKRTDPNSLKRTRSSILKFEDRIIPYFFLFFTAAEYGSVICDGVEMADIPTELQEARVFKLHLRNNGLHRFPDAKLQGTGKINLQKIWFTE